MNLPTLVNINGGTISYKNNAAGQKVEKVVNEIFEITKTEYLDGFEYKENKLSFFPHAEGYVNFVPDVVRGDPWLNYIFNYTDHLDFRDNVRNDPTIMGWSVKDQITIYQGHDARGRSDMQIFLYNTSGDVGYIVLGKPFTLGLHESGKNQVRENRARHNQVFEFLKNASKLYSIQQKKDRYQ